MVWGRGRGAVCRSVRGSTSGGTGARGVAVSPSGTGISAKGLVFVPEVALPRGTARVLTTLVHGKAAMSGL